MTFEELGIIPKLLSAIKSKGYETPTPIQEKAIPVILTQNDVLGRAQTGTGKTAAFAVPVLQLLSGSNKKERRPRALILAPTRELASQVFESFKTYGKNLHLYSAVVFGGVGINPQEALLRRGVDILIGCPGRLLDLINRKAVDLSVVEILILDEADRMLDMGFIHDIKRILKILPAERQNLLFSATFSREIRSLTASVLHNPVIIEIAQENSAAENINQTVYRVESSLKRKLLSQLINENNWFQVLVFTRTKHGANRLAEHLNKDNINSTAIHGNKSQNARTKALTEFKSKKIRVLVATDIAARGLDISGLPHVVNFDLPHVPEDYIHRIGRTGRAGAGGEAVSLVSGDERDLLAGIERLLKRTLPIKRIEGYGTESEKSTAPGKFQKSGQSKKNWFRKANGKK